MNCPWVIASMSEAVIRALVLAVTCLMTAIFLAGCAGRGKTISGSFGEFEVPPKGEIIEISLHSGDIILARKLEAEDDSVFAVIMDYSVVPIAIASIRDIGIRKAVSESPASQEGKPGKISPTDYTAGNLDAWNKAQVYLLVVSLVSLGFALMYLSILEEMAK